MTRNHCGLAMYDEVTNEGTYSDDPASMSAVHSTRDYPGTPEDQGPSSSAVGEQQSFMHAITNTNNWYKRDN